MQSTTNEQNWFSEAALGLFIHWGISSVDASGEISWGMLDDREGPSSPEAYYALAEEFDPDKYDPDKWLRNARQAGFEYAVFTAKHHDGFALWPSAYSEFTTGEYLDGRDLVEEYVEACRRQGLKVGLYFSISDWHHPDYQEPTRQDEPRPFTNEDRSLESPDELLRFHNFYSFVQGQLKELMTNYGSIDFLWFDGPNALWGGTNEDRIGDLYEMVRTLQPGIVIDGRGHYTHWGDYVSEERDLPETPSDRPWELSTPWADNWAYVTDDQYRDMAWTLERLARTTSGGGTLLLNVGPREDGTLPQMAYDRMAALGEWMADNAPAVTNVSRSPWPPRSDLPITVKEGLWYVHVLAKHEGPLTVNTVPAPQDVSLLRTGESVAFEHGEQTLTIQLSETDRTSPNEVVAITWPTGQEPS